MSKTQDRSQTRSWLDLSARIWVGVGISILLGVLRAEAESVTQAELQRLIVDQHWFQVIVIVDELWETQPQRREELEPYRDHLQQLYQELRPKLYNRFQLPFPSGQCYRISQGHHGSFSHFQRSNRYAWDFAMPVGARISAAGTGVVAVLEAGADRPDGQAIVLDHGDGIRSLYGHLSQIWVSQGQSVQAGQVIGLSGRASNGNPHLHYSLISAHPMVSLPSNFIDVSGNGIPTYGQIVCGGEG